MRALVVAGVIRACRPLLSFFRSSGQLVDVAAAAAAAAAEKDVAVGATLDIHPILLRVFALFVGLSGLDDTGPHDAR